MATITTINVGTSANDNTGDVLRNAFIKTNDNFTSVNSDLALKATIVNLALKAPIADPTFTGTINAPTISTTNDSFFNLVKVGRGGGNFNNNTALGNGSLNSNTTGIFNVAVGQASGFYNTTGQQNTFLGQDSGQKNTTGNSNTALGRGAGFSTTVGSANTSVGQGAGYYNVSGSNNTYLGEDAGANNLGNNNTFVGQNAGFSVTSSSNCTTIGYNADCNAGNQVTLGNTSVTSLRCNVQTITSLSDERDKTDIIEIIEGLDFVSKLKPVSFTWNQRDGGRVGIKSAGFIAQDLLQLQKDSLIGENLDLVSDLDTEKLEARYANLLPILVKAIQELKSEIEILKAK